MDIFSQPPWLGDLLIILSVALLDGLLSVDNALVIAEMVRKLPTEKQRRLALRAGLIGAYSLRFLSLFVVGIIIANPWLKLLGAFYLLYLMCENLGTSSEQEQRKIAATGFWQTVITLGLTDLSFSLDNVVAAVAFSPKFYIVCIGVAVSILAMRFVAGWFVKLIDRMPVLGKLAYVLVGFIGCSLLLEETMGWHIQGLTKVLALAAIIGTGVLVERVSWLNRLLSPLFVCLVRLMGLIAQAVDTIVVTPLQKVLGLIWRPFGFIGARICKALGISFHVD